MIKKILKLLRSVRLAVALIIILAILCLLGIIIPQIPSEFSATSKGYTWWVENVAFNQLGDIVYTLEPLELFNMFHSAWFIGAFALLLLNILFCSVSRINTLKAVTLIAAPAADAGFYTQGKYICEFETQGPVKALGDTAQNVLEQQRYSVTTSEKPDGFCIAGDKNRFSPWGTMGVHLSLILLLVGVLAGLLFGFRIDSFVVAEGASKDIGYGTGLSVHLNSFTDEYWDNGTPKDYKSNVDIFENGTIVKSGTVRVNHPLAYNGVRIHQGYFGPAVSLRITEAEGKVKLQENVALDNMRVNDSLHRPEGKVRLPANNYNIVIIGSAINGKDPYIGHDQIGVEFYDENMKFIGWLLLDRNSPKQMGDLLFTYDKIQYSGFLVSRDPGAVFFWIAAVFFLTGLAMIFYLPRRQVYIRLYSVLQSVIRINARLDTFKGLGSEDELLKIMKAMGLEEKPEVSSK